jgi:hypothetical protein
MFLSADSLFTIRVSFSPASTAKPSSLNLAHAFFAFFPAAVKAAFATLEHP